MSKKAEYSVLRLCFETPVRFGMGRSAEGLNSATMHPDSDQFFAAVCNEWVSLYGANSMSNVINKVRDGLLRFSGIFPWEQTISFSSYQGERIEEVRYYLPKPMIGSQHASKSGTQSKKVLKGINWIESGNFDSFLEILNTGQGNILSFSKEFGSEVVWDRVGTRSGGDNQLYRVAAWRFDSKRPWKEQINAANSDRKSDSQTQTINGLYWILQTEDMDILDMITEAVASLGISGIGGEVSSGLGKYSTIPENLQNSKSGLMVEKYLSDFDAPVQMSLGSVIPMSEEDFAVCNEEESRYLLTSRTGFTSSPDFCDSVTRNPLKKKSCNLIREGSCFSSRLTGGVLDLSYAGLHSVYRVGKTLFAGLRI